MRGNVTVMIGLAVVFGALAVFASRSWLDMQASQRLSEIENTRQPLEATTVVVADQPLRLLDRPQISPRLGRAHHESEARRPNGA